jgi:Cu-processing system ATP-binding protein
VDGALHLTCPQSEKLETLGRITGLGNKVADLDVLPPSLEDLYAHFSRGPQP